MEIAWRPRAEGSTIGGRFWAIATPSFAETTSMTSHMKPAVGRKIKAIQAKDGEKFYVGVDVHKRSYSVAIWSDQRGHVAQWTQPSDPAVLIGRLADAQQQVAWIVHEAGPT